MARVFPAGWPVAPVQYSRLWLEIIGAGVTPKTDLAFRLSGDGTSWLDAPQQRIRHDRLWKQLKAVRREAQDKGQVWEDGLKVEDLD